MAHLPRLTFGLAWLCKVSFHTQSGSGIPTNFEEECFVHIVRVQSEAHKWSQSFFVT